jgi:hypothetical protein
LPAGVPDDPPLLAGIESLPQLIANSAIAIAGMVDFRDFMKK